MSTPKSKTPKAKPLTLLGGPATGFPKTPKAETIETFANRFPHRDYEIRFDCEDFTSLCPVTAQPDFARIRIEYIADKRCIETKSLKFYLASYRNTKSFNEEVVNRILEHLLEACAPRWMLVHGEFASRGGIRVTVDAEHDAGTWDEDGIPF
jgi:7-cyano-7-deazaguanine reductase